MKHLFIAILLTSFFSTLWLAGNYPHGLTYLDKTFAYVKESLMNAQSNAAAVLLHKPVLITELKERYNAPSQQQKKIRILIVPGHEPSFGGTQYGNLKEREMNVQLAQFLGEFLKNNEHYDVMVARDNAQWNSALANYFTTEWNEIEAFFKDNKEDHYRMVNGLPPMATTSTGMRVEKPKVQHNAAPKDVALRLYGMNKYGNENAVDIAIHIHFNDYPRTSYTTPGRYSGFSVYIPESRYANSPATKAVAETVFKRLAKYNPVSNLPIEDDGIIEEPDLIAIGAHNTSNAASMLIEYGYIYEPQFEDPTIRARTLKDMAFQTYLGLQDFFGSGNDVSFAYDTLMLPHSFDQDVSTRKGGSEDVLALQTALLIDGLYPGAGKTKNDCPRSGKLGPCTLGALEAFQKRYGIKGEEGYVGEKTRQTLNEKYSIQAI